MNKKIFMFFAVLSAIVLTFCFTSCGDDDDNDDVYTATYQVYFSCQQGGEDDLQNVITAFATAFNLNITEKEVALKITGTDSETCGMKLQAMILVAEAALKNKTAWEAPVTIVIKDSSNNVVFQKTYGSSSDNGVV